MGIISIGMYSNANGAVYVAAANRSTRLQDQQETSVTVKADLPEVYQNPTGGNLSEEEAKKIGINAIADKFGLSQKETEKFHVSIRARYSSPLPPNIADMKPAVTVAGGISADTEAGIRPSDETEVLLWNVTLTPVNEKDYPTIDSYSALIDDKSSELMNVRFIPLINTILK